MNNLSWFLYIADVVGSLNITILVLIAILTLLSGFFFMGYIDNDKGLEEQWIRYSKRLIIAAATCLVMSVFIPSEKTMYLMLGSEVSEEMINSETGKRVQSVINKKLDEYLNVAEKVTDTE